MGSWRAYAATPSFLKKSLNGPRKSQNIDFLTERTGCWKLPCFCGHCHFLTKVIALVKIQFWIFGSFLNILFFSLTLFFKRKVIFLGMFSFLTFFMNFRIFFLIENYPPKSKPMGSMERTGRCKLPFSQPLPILSSSVQWREPVVGSCCFFGHCYF